MVGRLISKDPIRFHGGQANLYAYVGSNPVNALDSTGLWYVDFNFSGGYLFGVTGGVFYDGTTDTFHPYLGAGLVTAGAGLSLNYSDGIVSPKFWSGQVQSGFGFPVSPLLGIGPDAAVGTDATGSKFKEAGVCIGTPGFSASQTGYYTW